MQLGIPLHWAKEKMLVVASPTEEKRRHLLSKPEIIKLF